MAGPTQPDDATDATMSSAELAAEVGVDPAVVDALVAAGALRQVAPGRHERADIPRLMVVRRLDEAGIPVDVVTSAIETRFSSLDFIGRYFMDPGPMSDRTYGAFTTSLGAQAPLLPAIYAAFGLPEPDPALPIRRSDEAIVTSFLDAWAPTGSDPEPYVRAARLAGEGVRRVIDGWTELWGEAVVAPLERRGVEPTEQLELVGEPSTKLGTLAPALLVWLEQRHLEHRISAMNIDAFEAALAEREGRAPPSATPIAIAFVDLAGYTSMTDRAGDEMAVRSAARLQELSDAVARRHDGRVVKLLGDGAMLRMPDIARGLPAVLELVEAIAGADLPPAHAGIEAGRVVDRDGDVYGRTVNLAARIADRANAGDVLLGPGAAAAWHAVAGIELRPLPPVELKGIEAPVSLWRVERVVGEPTVSRRAAPPRS
jgi:adenylate cyclase